MSKNTRTINVIVTPETHAKLREVAKADLRTMKALTQKLVTEYADRQYAKLKESQQRAASSQDNGSAYCD